MLLAGLVVDWERLLERGLHHVAGHGRGRRGEVRDVLEDSFERVDRAPSVALRVTYEQLDRIVTEASLALLPSPLGLSVDRPPHDRPDVLRRQRLQYEHPTPRQQRLGQLRSEEHTSELQSRLHLVCRLLLEKKKKKKDNSSLKTIDAENQTIT